MRTHRGISQGSIDARMKFSLVIPAYNEAGNIGNLVEECFGAIPAKMLGEIIVVDDCSSDETAFNGNAALEILFNSSNSGGGLATIDLYGNCKFMAEFDIGAPPTYDSTGTAVPDNDAQIKGFFNLSVRNTP